MTISDRKSESVKSFLKAVHRQNIEMMTNEISVEETAVFTK